MKNLYWVANYITNQQLKQFNEDGTENNYKDIDRSLLRRFDMVESDTDKPIHSLYLDAGQSLIFRRRTFKKVGKPDVIVYLVGYLEKIITPAGVHNKIVITYIHPDGSTSLDGARNDLELLDIEK